MHKVNRFDWPDQSQHDLKLIELIYKNTKKVLKKLATHKKITVQC